MADNSFSITVYDPSWTLLDLILCIIFNVTCIEGDQSDDESEAEASNRESDKSDSDSEMSTELSSMLAVVKNSGT